MKTKRLKLKRWASVAIYLYLVSIIVISMIFVGDLLNKNYGEPYNISYILKNFIDNDIPVINYKEEIIIKPYTTENINIDIDFYDKDSDESTQQKSLILYENTYMPNTGILYSSDEQFEVVATLDGTITKLSTDELLGTVIEITHSSSLITTYYSVDNINVKEGQTIKKGDIIGTSGKNNISSTSDNMLLFEVSLNGNNIDPKKYYETKLEDLN
ncbi:MAG: M23 family metallopeptidase [Bacilli bacterium]|nr:M23 family metallopeptidase [Bacilli bacterium]